MPTEQGTAMPLSPTTAGEPAAGSRDIKRIGIVAALPAELAPLTRGWKPLGTDAPQIWTGQLRMLDGSVAEAFAANAGMGAAAATRAFAAVQAAGRLDAVISYGWAGAITCGVKPPDVYAATEVIDSQTGERFATATPAGPAPIRLVTLDHVARSNEKRPLAERYQAVLVDMEAATVARLAQAHGIPFYCCKGISDAYTDVLPDFNRFLDFAGQLRLAAFVGYALLRPRYWGALARLGASSKAAARNLASQLPTCFARAGLLS